MRRLIATTLVVALLAVSLSGCATNNLKSNTAKGAGIGAATGAAVGGTIGAIMGGKKWAAIGAGIGAVIGAAIGGGIGKYFDDKKERDRTQSVEAVAYKPELGNVILVSGSSVNPTPVKPGEEVRIKVSYDVLAANPDQTVPIAERWVVLFQGQPVADPIVRPVQHRTQGGYASTFKFTVNRDFFSGHYEIVTTISNGHTEREVRSTMQVENL